MKQRHKLAVVFAAAAVLFGAGGAVAAAHSMQPQPAHSPAITDGPTDGPDTPGVPDLPEPGDTPDAGD
jgi:hypothetical protein